MTPHRIPTAAAAIRQAFAIPPDPSVGVLAGLVTIFASFWNLHVVMLVGLVGLVGVVDLWAGARRAEKTKRPDGTDAFDKKQLDDGAWGKLFYLAVSLVLGVSIDALISLTGGAFDLGFVDPFKSLTPATTVALFVRFGKEVKSIGRNIEQTPGGEGQVLDFAKLVDLFRYRAAHPGEPMPAERYDDPPSEMFTAEELAWLAERRRAAAQPEPEIVP